MRRIKTSKSKRNGTKKKRNDTGKFLVTLRSSGRVIGRRLRCDTTILENQFGFIIYAPQINYGGFFIHLKEDNKEIHREEKKPSYGLH